MRNPTDEMPVVASLFWMQKTPDMYVRPSAVVMNMRTSMRKGVSEVLRLTMRAV